MTRHSTKADPRQATPGATLACAFCAAAMSVSAAAQSVCYTVVTDQTTSIYGIGDTPALCGDELAFYGDWKAALLTGIYTVPVDLSGPFRLMVNSHDPVPNEGYLTYFYSLQNPAVRDGAVTFTGGNTNDADGLYWSNGQTIVTLVDSHAGFPSPYPRPSMGSDGVAFIGKGGFEVPWFVEYVNPTPAKVYASGSAAPGGGTFIKTEPGVPAMGNTVMAFSALCSKPGGSAGGMYTWNSLSNQISLVANWNTVMPGTANTKFDYLFECDTDDQRTVFSGKSGFIGFGGRVGVFEAAVGSTVVSKIAIDGDPAPDGQIMSSFGSVAVEGDFLAFVGTLGSPISPTGAMLIGRIGEGPDFEIVRTGGTIMGRTVLDFDFNHRALSGHRVAFRALLSDPSSPLGSSYAMVVADIDVSGAGCPPAPAPGSNDPAPPYANCAEWSTPTAPEADSPVMIRGVEVLADDDIWMVGAAGVATHFDGVEWTVMTTPPVNGKLVHYEDVSASSPDDVWACGAYVQDGVNVLAIARWNGVSWTHLPVPQPPALAYLSDIEAIAPDDVYACGYRSDATRFLLLHWNGFVWSEVSLPPSVNTINQQLWTLTSTGPDNIYAAGAILPNGGAWEAVIYRFDGRAWTKVPNVPQPEGNPIIYDMTAVSPTDIWAVGDMFVVDAGKSTMTMHYDGVNWTHVPSPNPGAGWNLLFGVAASDANHVVACGYHYYGAVNEPIAMTWDAITGTWKGYDMPMPGYSTSAWAAGALSDGSLLVAGGIGYYTAEPADCYLHHFGKPGGAADFDCSGSVDGADLAALLSEWGLFSPSTDLDGDGEVGGSDLGLLLAAWS